MKQDKQPKKPNKKVVGVWLDADMKAELKALAAADLRTTNQYITALLMRHIEEKRRMAKLVGTNEF